MRRLRRGRLAFALLLAPMGFASSPEAQEIAVPVEVQIPLLVKILGFDRKLAARSDNELVLGILFQGKYRTSANVADEVKDAVRRLPAGAMGGRRIRAVAIDLDDATGLDAALSQHRIAVLYVSPLRAADIRALTAICRASQVTSVTGVPAYVETGISIGIGIKGERPEIVINLAASRAEGADLNAQLLKLARIVE
jgi:hypothetical protein